MIETESALLLADDILDLSQASIGVNHSKSVGTCAPNKPDASKNRPVCSTVSASEDLECSDSAEDDESADAVLQDVNMSHTSNTRSKSDMKVYGYYISHIGSKKFLAFLTCCIVQVLGFYIPRRSHSRRCSGRCVLVSQS